MFEQVVTSLRQATEATAQMQQEMFKTLFKLWPGVSAPGQTPGGEQLQSFGKQLAEATQEAIKRQRELADAQFKAGMQIIETSFKMGEVKNPDELRARTIDLWRQCFESLRGAYEAQAREFQSGMQKWIEMITKTVAPQGTVEKAKGE